MFGPRGWRWLLGLAVLTAGVAWGQEQAMPARLDPDGVQRLTLVGGNYHFQPDRIRVQIGVPVELEVYRTTRTPHDLVIQDDRMGLDITVDLALEPVVVRFTPEVTGRVVFYCDQRLLFLPSHRARGMWGVLEVID